jgi:hypothetical protein
MNLLKFFQSFSTVESSKKQWIFHFPVSPFGGLDWKIIHWRERKRLNAAR